MSEGRKRSRKTKLQVRDDDCEFEILTGETNTTKSQELQRTRRLRILDHDYCIPGSRGYTIQVPCDDEIDITFANNFSTSISRTLGPSNLELSVKVEVEPFNELQNTHDTAPQGSSDSTMAENVQKPTDRKSGAGSRKNKQKPSIKMCKYSPETIYSVSDHIAATSQNLADKILDIEMRNLWGDVLHTPHSLDAHDSLLQNALDRWQTWFHVGRNIRDSPLFYQCHICNVAWWRLHPFQLHIKDHAIQDLQVKLNENVHECVIVATYKDVGRVTYIDIEDDCWRCGRTLNYHKSNSGGYTCNRCQRGFYTCVLLKEHEARCMNTNLEMYNIAPERRCTLCLQVIDCLKDIDKHMIESHSPRTDIPMPSVFKVCAVCNQKYFTYTTHNCSKSARNSGCSFCCKKFATKPLATSHMLSPYNRPILCRICSELLQTKCMELQHMHEKHSDNYQFAFKCTICTNQYLLFVDEVSIKAHRELWHNKKADRRRAYYEVMLVPRNCLQDSTEEAALPAPTEDTKDFCIDGATLPKLRRLTAEMSAPQVVTTLDVHRMPDVDVTVDEVDLKKEPECNENGEVDYEEMLHKMFSIDSEENKTENELKVEDEKKESKALKADDMKEFDFANVKIKSEPIDEIEIHENPVEIVQVKTEPIDTEQDTNTEEPENYQIVDPTAAIKVELDTGDIKTENIEIKSEIERLDDGKILDYLDLSTESHMEGENDEQPLIFSETYKKRKKWSRRKYTCNKCGYTDKHKEYKLHVEMKCAMSPSDKSHKCTKCNLIFFTFREYLLHFDRHGLDMTCPACGVRLGTISKLGPHVRKHIKGSFIQFRVLNQTKVITNEDRISRLNREYKCTTCHDIVVVRELFAHWERHLTLASPGAAVKEEPQELSLDSERVTVNNKILDPAALKLAIEHLVSMDSSEKECTVCFRAFARRYDVKRHLVEHLLMDAHMNKSKHNGFRCQICSKSFERPEKYKYHMREHGCLPIYKCELCNKTFSDSSNFAKHKKTHNVRVLICDLCNKKFHGKSTLEKHIAEHPTRPVVKCQYCDKSFANKSSYKKHKYSVHEKAKFKCVLCDLSFTSLQRKWDHNWEVHKERKDNADCPICLQSFRKFHDVRVHARKEHKAEVAVIKQRNRDVCFYKVRDIGYVSKRKEILVVKQ